MIEIGISSRSSYPFDKKLLRGRVKKFLQGKGVGEVELSIAMVGERKDKSFGQIMGAVMGKLRGKVSGEMVAVKVREMMGEK